MTETRYGFGVTLQGIGFDDALGRTAAALQAEGFGVLTEIDVQATLKKKLDVDFRRYMILGACNPTLAKRALDAEPGVGLLLPCNVVLQETSAGVEISIADPKAVFTVVDNPAVAPVVDEAESSPFNVRLAHREEREVAAELGDTWRCYAAATPRWFPRVGGGSLHGQSSAGGA